MVARYALILCFFLPAGAAAADLSFADHLFGKKEYAWAHFEYERLLCAFPDSSAVPQWRFRGARSLMHLGRFDQALQGFSLVSDSGVPIDSVRLYSALCALRINRHKEARIFLSSCPLDYSRILQAYLDASDGRYSAALDTLKLVPLFSPDAFRAQAMEKAVTDASVFRKKQYAPALVLSLVPGLGHLYTGRSGDAAMSAITIATGALITGYYGYHGSRERMYAAGTVAGLFYAGSMYGAAVSVKIYNRTSVRRQRETVEKIVFGP